MITPEVISYVKKSLAQGMRHEDVRKVLLDAGWSNEDITEAIIHAGALSEENSSPASHAPGRAKKYGIIIGVAAGVLVLGGAAFAYAAFSFLHMQNNNKLLSAALANNTPVTSGKAHLSFTMGYIPPAATSTAPTPFERPWHLIFTDDTAFDSPQATSSQRLDAQIGGTFETQQSSGAPSLFSAQINARIISNTLYLKIAHVSPSVLALYPPLNTFLNQWFSLSLKESSTTAQAARYIPAPVPLASLSGKKNAETKKAIADIQKLLASSHLFVITRDEGMKKGVHKFRLGVDQSAAQHFASSVVSILRTDMPSTPLTSSEATHIQKNILLFMSLLNDPSIADIQIGVTDNPPAVAQFSIALTLTPATLKKIYVAAGINTSFTTLPDGTLHSSFTIALTERNQTQDIRAPATSVPFMRAIEKSLTSAQY